MSNIDQEREPSESYVAAPRQLNGTDLHPFTMGNRALVGLIGRPGDTDELWLQCVLYVLSHDRAEVQKLTRDRDEARLALLAWLDGFSDEQMRAALKLAEEIVTESKKDKVDPIATAASGNESAPAK